MAGERHRRGMGTACYMWIGLWRKRVSAPFPQTRPNLHTTCSYTSMKSSSWKSCFLYNLILASFGGHQKIKHVKGVAAGEHFPKFHIVYCRHEINWDLAISCSCIWKFGIIRVLYFPQVYKTPRPWEQKILSCLQNVHHTILSLAIWIGFTPS